LTGNVAAGKSAVLDLFTQWGAAAVDHDVLAREAVAPGSPGLERVRARFGPAVFLKDGSLDRSALRHRITSDAAEREALNAIVHPEVSRLAAQREAELRHKGAAIVVHDIPLLFEVLDPANYNAVVLVDAPEAVRRQRLVANRGLSAAEADALIAAQMPSSAKRARSQFVIENDRDRPALEAAALGVWRKLQERAGIV
jgi:dephospho-CoA kinase